LQLCGSKDGFCLLGLNRGKEMRKNDSDSSTTGESKLREEGESEWELNSAVSTHESQLN